MTPRSLTSATGQSASRLVFDRPVERSLSRPFGRYAPPEQPLVSGEFDAAFRPGTRHLCAGRPPASVRSEKVRRPEVARVGGTGWVWRGQSGDGLIDRRVDRDRGGARRLLGAKCAMGTGFRRSLSSSRIAPPQVRVGFRKISDTFHVGVIGKAHMVLSVNRDCLR